MALVTSGREKVDARFYNLTPQGLLDTAYVLPVNSMANGTDRSLGVRLYLYAYEPLTYYVYQGTTAAPIAQAPSAARW